MRSLRSVLRKVMGCVCVGAVLAQPGAVAAPVTGPASVEDPYYGQVLFDFYQADYFNAIVNLLAAQSRQRLPNHSDDAELLLGGMYLSYGLHDKAAEIFNELLNSKTTTAVRDRAWFFLAKIRYQRGYLEEALAALNQIQSDLDIYLEPERRMITTQTLMALNRYDDAAALLGRWQESLEWRNYAAYNLGVALLRSGKLDAGAELLSAVGERPVADEESASLRDKANLALGYAYLQNGQSSEGRTTLQRVRLEGPFSNKALLGVGWADAEQENYRRALVPWLELRGRDLLDSAVQESLLAIPYAYSKLDANSEAAQQYQRAIDAYVDETRRLDDAIARIESGEVVQSLLADDRPETMGWFWQLDGVPDTFESRYLYHLLAAHEFQEALKNYRDLRFLKDILAEWQQSFDVFANMLDTRERAFDTRLPRSRAALDTADLDALRQRRDRLSTRLDRIEAERDVVQLAPGRKREMWSEIERLEASPGLAANLAEAEDARSKLRLMKGVLAWEMDVSFPARLWRQRQDLRAIERSIERSDGLRKGVADALVSEPRRYAEFDDRIGSLAAQIEQMLARVDALVARQGQEVNRIAISELEARKDRLDTYTLQARYALASIYDRASSRSDQ